MIKGNEALYRFMYCCLNEMEWKEFLKFTWQKLVIFLLLLIVLPFSALLGMLEECQMTSFGGKEPFQNFICNASGVTFRILWPTLLLANNQSSLVVSILAILAQSIYTYFISSVIIVLFKKIRK